MRKSIYDAIYRVWEIGGGEEETIIVGDNEITIEAASDDNEYPSIWNYGIKVNGRKYTLGDLYSKNTGPGNFAELFSGEYDIISSFADIVYEKYV